MEEYVTPTAEELLDEDGFEEVEREFDDDWRHGGTRNVVYRRESDDSFWSVAYRISTDGEFNGLREDEYSVFRVVPKQVTTTTYVKAD